MRSTALLASVTILTLGGCSASDGNSATVESGLDVTRWSRDIQNTSQTTLTPPAATTLNGVASVVYQEYCPTGCSAERIRYDNWTDISGWSVQLPHDSTTSRPSLAVLNGVTYMIYASNQDQYLTRFVNGAWQPSTLLPFLSFDAAAIAPFGNELVIVRAEPTENGRLHMLMMDANYNFTADTPIVRTIDGSGGCGAVVKGPPLGGLATATPALAGVQYYEYATSTPALTNWNGCLYMAHRDGATNTLVYNTFGSNWPMAASWGSQRIVTSGTGGAAQTSSVQPSLAVYGGVLHLVHTGASGRSLDNIWWTTFTPASGWSLPLSVPYHLTAGTPSLVALSDRLLMIHQATHASGDEFGIWSSYWQ